MKLVENRTRVTKKTNRIQEQKILVNMMDLAELFVMAHPECGKDKKRNELMVKSREQGEECSTGSLRYNRITGGTSLRVLLHPEVTWGTTLIIRAHIYNPPGSLFPI